MKLVFNVLGIRRGKSGDPLHSDLIFLSLFLIVAIVIMLFILYVSGVPAG